MGNPKDQAAFDQWPQDLEGLGEPLAILWQAITKARYKSEQGSESLTLWYDQGERLEITDWLNNVSELAMMVETNLARAKPPAASGGRHGDFGEFPAP